MVAKPLDIQLPLKGLNTIDPHGPWDSGYARELTNYSIHNGRLYMRPAVREVVYTASVGEVVSWFDVSSSPSWYAILTTGAIRKLSDGTGATNIGGSVTYGITRAKHSSLDLIFGAREPRAATNPFDAWTFTPAAVTATSIRAGCSHKGRLYVTDGTTIEYSDLAAITGNLNNAGSYASVLDGQMVIRMFSITISMSNSAENVLVIFADGGRVLVYQGDYPGSTTWYLIGKFDMPAPVSNVGFVEVDGDIFVATKQYAYFFRDLFTQGAQSAYTNSPTRPIENIWSNVTWFSSALPYMSSFYEPVQDAIITIASLTAGDLEGFADNSVQYEADLIYFVFFRKYRAWAVWFGPPIIHPHITSGSGNSAVTYGVDDADGRIVRLTHGSAVDQALSSGSPTNISIETAWKTPYLKTGAPVVLRGVQPNFENTISGYFERIRAIFDRSDFNAPLGWYTQNTGQTPVAPGVSNEASIDLPASGWDQYDPHIGLSGEGKSLSIQFTQMAESGSSATQSQSIYGATIFIEQGRGL